MKFYERTLLDNLQSAETQDVPLKNVRNAMGSIGQTAGNPLSKTEIAVSVRLVFHGAGGVVVAPALLPANLQTKIPYVLFGLTDFYGGFSKAMRVNTPFPTWFFNSASIVGYNGAVVPANIAAETGDLVIRYNEPTGANVAFAIIHCNNVAYGTFLNSFVSDLITISHIRYFVNLVDIDQFNNPFNVSYQTLFGKLTTDSLDPRLFILNKDPNQTICDLPVNLPIDKSIIISSFMNFDCIGINYILFVEKVEPLTQKRRR